MSTRLPTISVTSEKHTSQSEESSSSDDSYSNDMDYGQNGGGVTDVEDFDSQMEQKPRSRRGSTNMQQTQQKKSPLDNDVTDVEDYNTESEDDEKSIAYPELKLSLQEFLDVAIQNQEVVDNDAKESCVIKPGDFLQAQDLNGFPDYLTDCEDYNTDSEIDYGCEKSVCVDLNNAVGEQGRVSIADKEKSENDDSDNYEDVSVISDISDLAAALPIINDAGARGLSEDEVLEMSGEEVVCRIACSDSEDDDAACKSDSISEASIAPIDVAFICASGQACLNSKATTPVTERKNFLQIAPRNDEVLTDVEGIDDSAAEDSFDNDDDNQAPIPRAVILAPGDDGTCLTDVEDMFCDDDSLLCLLSEIRSVTAEALPLPHREMVELKEDKYGDTTTNVMPMDNEYEFGIYNHLKDAMHTDSEEYSCADDIGALASLVDDVLNPANLTENDVIVSNEVMKSHQNKRLELQNNTESVTDVEEIVVAGTNRRKKLKGRASSKGKLKLPEIVKAKEEAITDVEDMELSDCGLPLNVKRVEQLSQPTKSAGAKVQVGKVTDVEDLTADEVSDVSEASASSAASAANASFCRSHSPENGSTGKSCSKARHHALNLHVMKDDTVCQQNTDVEDVQFPSDTEEFNDRSAKAAVYANCKELNDMLNESYTVVHEKNSSSFNVEAERLHIKGLPRDAHTDVEYVESDESAARGGN